MSFRVEFEFKIWTPLDSCDTLLFHPKDQFQKDFYQAFYSVVEWNVLASPEYSQRGKRGRDH